MESSCKVLINKSSSLDVYSAGGDLVNIQELTRADFADFLHHVYRIHYLSTGYRIPYVSLISGLTLGGSSCIYCTGKYRVVTEKTLYWAPEVFVGNTPDAGQAYVLSKLNNNLGKYLALTGAKLKGYDMKRIGLATHFVESRHLQGLENELTKCENDEQVGDLLNFFSSEPSDHMDRTIDHIDKIKRLFSEKNVEDILENLKLDGSDWAKDKIKIMSRASPTSMKVTLKVIDLCRNLSLRDACELQYVVNRRIHEKGDFVEGARAFISKKPFNPSWNPKTLDEISQDQINSFFEAYEDDVFTPESERNIHET